MKTILKIFIAAILLLVVLSFFLNAQYTLQRQTTIQAPYERIHDYVGNLKQWHKWTPWAEQDPSIIVKIKQATGVGAHQSWVGDSGKGELTFTKTSPIEGIEYNMIFDDKYPAISTMSYQPQGNTTLVIWSMSGENNIPVVGPYFALMMDQMIGPMFDRGLEKLKIAVENQQ